MAYSSRKITRYAESLRADKAFRKYYYPVFDNKTQKPNCYLELPAGGRGRAQARRVAWWQGRVEPTGGVTLPCRCLTTEPGMTMAQSILSLDTIGDHDTHSRY